VSKPAVAAMTIQLKKGRDGPSSLACVRANGTRTWSRLHPFFPAHDLAHCAVESVLGFREAFFGLVASGWEIDDFAKREVRAGMPPEALWAENAVGLFDLERTQGRPFDAAGFNEALASSLQVQKVDPCRPIFDDELIRVRALRDELVGRWWALAPGETLDVPFSAVTC